MLSNDWHRLTGTQWAMMGLILLLACVISLMIERASRPRVSKWSDWKRRR